MDFWDSFWATVWGALAGAVVGALAAWGFALDLRRRDRATAHRDAMTRWLGRVMDALTTYEEVFRNWPPGPSFPGMHQAAYEAASAARADVLSALRTALLDADEVEHPVLEAAREAIVASGATKRDAQYVSYVAVMLSGWWRGEVSAEDALVAFARMHGSAGTGDGSQLTGDLVLGEDGVQDSAPADSDDVPHDGATDKKDHAS